MTRFLEPSEFTSLPGWPQDDPRPVIEAMRRCGERVIHVKPYRTGSLGITVDDLLPALQAASDFVPATAEAARAFFETWFQPFRIAEDGFVTGYYEPEIAVSDTPDARFRFPVYRRPDDLVELDDANRPREMDAGFAFARTTSDGIREYFDRAAIECGALEGRNLEIAYAESRIDLFFVHIQGAARLVYRDGRSARITYAAKSGHPFTPIGRILIERGELARETVTMGAIRRWLADHPDDADWLMWENSSFIFFREAPVTDAGLGPVAAAKVALMSGRSLAVDRLIHTFATPFFVCASTLTHLDDGASFQRLMLAQDTGSAIVGPARGDIFVGSGEAAGNLAGAIRHPAAFFVLVPRTAAERFA